MSEEVKQKLPPRPDLRSRRVAQTEAQIIEAARVLFLDQGYVSTTLTQIAEQAGVADRTIYVRFGSKAALFSRVVDKALVGDAEPVDLAHRPEVNEAMTAKTLVLRIEAFADLSVAVAERAGSLFEVAAQSEGLEPEIAVAAQAGREATLQLCRTFWKRAAKDGLANGLDPERLTLLTDVLLSADTVVHIRRAHGWSAETHRSLIVETLNGLTTRSD